MRSPTCLVVLALALAGCAGPAATTAGSATAASSPPPSAGSVVPVPSASAVASELSADPPPLPSGFPVHESMVEIETPAGATAAWTSDARPPALYDYYLSALPVAGFEIDLEAPGGSAAILRFHGAGGVAYQLDLSGLSPIAVTLGAPHP